MPRWNGWYAREEPGAANTAACRKPGRGCLSKSIMSSPASIADARFRATSRSLATTVTSTGPNLTGLDPATGQMTRLYHPRRHKWSHHFRFDGSILIGRTAIGRTTIDVLRMNHPQLVALRDILMAAGIF